MDGLLNYTNNNIMKKWYRLFVEQNKIHSNQKYTYWKKITQCGLPNIKDEQWKYIPLKKLFSHTLSNTYPALNHIDKLNRKNFNMGFKSYKLVFVNGFFSKTLSSQNFGPWKIKIVNRDIEQILPEPIKPEIFLYLIECLSYETIYISLPNNTISKIPLYLLHINQGCENNKQLITFHYRHHIEICNNAHAQIIEHYTSINKNSYFIGSRISIMLDKNSQVEHIKLSCDNRKSYHIAHNDIHINSNSTIQSNIFNISGSHFSKHQTSVSLNNKLSSVSLNSLLLPLKKDISDISTNIIHHHPGHNSSKQMHKIIAANQGLGIFRGLIQVNKQAKKINGSMTNKNLLLNRSSKVYSMPQLEIYSDDITCNHGATIGHIDQEQIFYLCSRGIEYKKACQIVVYAFALEIIENITNWHIQKTLSNQLTNILIRTFCNDLSYKENSI